MYCVSLLTKSNRKAAYSNAAFLNWRWSDLFRGAIASQLRKAGLESKGREAQTCMSAQSESLIQITVIGRAETFVY